MQTLSDLQTYLDTHPGHTVRLTAIGGFYFARIETSDMRALLGSGASIADAIQVAIEDSRGSGAGD